MKDNKKRFTNPHTEHMLQGLMQEDPAYFNEDDEQDYYEDTTAKDANAEIYQHKINFARLSQQTYSHLGGGDDDFDEEYDDFNAFYQALDKSKRQSIDMALNMSNLSNEK